MTVQNPMMQALTGLLSRNPKATFAECRDALAPKGFKLYPITYGRAQVIAGIVKARPRGTGPKRAPKSPQGSVVLRGGKRIPVTLATYVTQPKRGPGRPRKIVPATDIAETLKAGIERLQRERDEALAALAEIRRAVG